MGVLWSLDPKGVRGTAGGRSLAGRPGKGGGQRDMESSWGIQATFTSDEEICIPGGGGTPNCAAAVENGMAVPRKIRPRTTM